MKDISPSSFRAQYPKSVSPIGVGVSSSVFYCKCPRAGLLAHVVTCMPQALTPLLRGAAPASGCSGAHRRTACLTIVNTCGDDCHRIDDEPVSFENSDSVIKNVTKASTKQAQKRVEHTAGASSTAQSLYCISRHFPMCAPIALGIVHQHVHGVVHGVIPVLATEKH